MARTKDKINMVGMLNSSILLNVIAFRYFEKPNAEWSREHKNFPIGLLGDLFCNLVEPSPQYIQHIQTLLSVKV